MRNRVELLNVWEQIINPNFKVVEFDNFKSQAELHNFNIGERATIRIKGEANADFILDALSKKERFEKLRNITRYRKKILDEQYFWNIEKTKSK